MSDHSIRTVRRLAQAQFIGLRLLAIACATVSAHAQTWTGATNGTFSTASNWSPGLPANDGTATATFGAVSTTAINLDASWNLSGLVFNSSSATNYGFTTTNSSTLTLGSAGISVSAGDTASFGNGIVLGAGTVPIIDAGTLTLSGVVSGSGTLAVSGSGSVLGTLTIANSGGLTISGAALSNTTVNLIGGALTTTTAITLGGLSGTATVTSTALAVKTLTVGGNNLSTTFSGVISGKLGVTKVGTGALTLSGISTYTGSTIINNGTLLVSGSLSGGATVNSGGFLQVGNAGETGTLGGSVTINNGVNGPGTLEFNRSNDYTISTTITGSGQLVQAGTGIITLMGNNGFSGVIKLNAGELSVGTISNGGTVNSNLGGSSKNASSLIFDGGALQYTGASASIDRAFTVNSGAAIFDITTNDLTLVGINNIFGTGTGLTKLGAGTLTLGDGVTDPIYGYTGATTVSAGTLVVNGSIAASSGVALASGTSLAGTGSVSAVTLAGSNTISSAVTLATAGITVSGTGNTLSSGIVTGNTTVGSGAAFAIASGATLTGTATSAGLLTNNGTISSTVEIQNGGTLKGAGGTFNGAVTIDSGGTLSPGNSPGLATFGNNLTLNGTTQMEINGTSRGTTYDAVNVAGTLTYGGTLNLVFSSTVTAGQTYNLLNGADGTSTPTAMGNFSSISLSGSYNGTLTDSSGVWTGTEGGLEFTYTDSTGELTTSLSSVPEPSSYALIFGGLALGAAFYRRRRALVSDAQS